MSDQATEVTDDVQQLVTGSNQFAVDLYLQVASESDGDLFFSPSSISFALAMTMAGASGETAREIREVLGIPLPNEKLHEAFRDLRQTTRTGGVEFRSVNRLWGQAGYQFLPEFCRLTDECYGAAIAPVDFEKATEQARQEINSWVEEQTNNRIQDLIPPGMISEITRLVLTNAVYFLGTWENEFNEDRTQDFPFRASETESHPVEMMRQTSDFRFGEFEDVIVLEMPYRPQMFALRPVMHGDIEGFEHVEVPDGGSDFALCILLPRKVNGLSEVEAQLSSANIQEWTTLRECKVDAMVPKFRIETARLLGQSLQELGIRQAFSVDEADFSNATDHPDGLVISEAIHKAFVDVNEKGTEAAAASAIVMRAGCAMKPEPPKEFRADHPFVFLIRDRRTRLIHFMGRVMLPEYLSN